MKWNIENIVKEFDILFTVLLLLQSRINLDTFARLAAGTALENASRLLKANSMHFACALCLRNAVLLESETDFSV